MEKPPTMETIIVWWTFFHTMSMYCTTTTTISVKKQLFI